MSEPEVVTLTRDDGRHPVTVDVDLGEGGRLAQITVGGHPLLIDDADSRSKSSRWGAFPQAPWTNRIRNGRFRLFGVDQQLETNHADRPAAGGVEQRHAIHGTVYARPWILVDKSTTTVTAQCPIDTRLGWPYPGTATHRVSLAVDAVQCELSVAFDGAPDTPAMPAEIGWHPWFVKPARLDFEPVAMYARDATDMFIGELIEPSAGPWDDCFVSHEPITLHYDRPGASTVTVTSDCDHWIVFDKPDHATCVEPQSGPPDAVSIRPRVITPDRPLQRRMRIGWH
ncbi:MAG: aldose epimerase [Actinomycetota bacterium]